MEVGSGSREKGMVRYWRLVIQTTALALILDLLYGQELRIGIQISIGYDPTKSLKISQTTNGRRPIKRPKGIKLQTDEAQSNARRASNFKRTKPNQTPEGHQTSNGRSPLKRPKGIKPQLGEAQANARRASNLMWAKPNQTPEGHRSSRGLRAHESPPTVDHSFEMLHQFGFAVKIHFPGFTSFARTHYTKVLQLIHDPPGPVVSEFEFSLEHRSTSTVIEND